MRRKGHNTTGHTVTVHTVTVHIVTVHTVVPYYIDTLKMGVTYSAPNLCAMSSEVRVHPSYHERV